MTEKQFYNRVISNTLTLSYSSAKLLLEESTPLQFMRYYTRDRSNDKRTPSMLLGSLIHCILLEPENFAKNFVIKELEDKKRLKRLQRIAHRKRFDIITEAQLKKAIAICQDVRLNPDAKEVLQGSKEQKITDTILDIPFKGYVDVLSSNFITDIKTTTQLHPNKFYWEFKKYGYELQAAIYCEMTFRNKFYIFGVSSQTGMSRKFDLSSHIPIGRDMLRRVIKRYKHLQRLSKVFDPATIWTNNQLQSHTY